MLLGACFLPLVQLGPFSANMFNIVGVATTAGRYAPHVNLETGLWLLHGLYVVPLLALLLIVQELRGRAAGWLRILTGAVALAGPLAITLGARALFVATPLPPLPADGGLLRRLPLDRVPLDLLAPKIGAGWIAIGLTGVVLVTIGIWWGKKS